MDRTVRQKSCVNKWLAFDGKGTVEACTGFGKTRVALMIIKSLLKSNSKASIMIIVPTTVLKEQWNEQLENWNLIDNCNIEIINTAITKNWVCDLLIIDEAHMMASDMFSAIFTVVTYKMILCLTATLQRLDGKEVLIKKYAPVCDTIPISEALTEGWVAPIKEYVVLLDVDLSDYKMWDQKFNAYFAYFNWDFTIAMGCLQDWKFRNRYAKQLGLTPKDVMAMSADWMRCMQKRKQFILSHPKKLEVCRKILEARKDKKCITFSATIDDSKRLGVGQVLHSKQSKKKNAEIIKAFNESESGVLCTSKAADAGVDIKGLSVGIIMSIDSSKIRKTQRVGRIVRFEPNKVAELFTLIIKGTQEWHWFQNSNTSKNTIVIDENQLNKVLRGEDITARPINESTNISFRF